MYRRAVQAAGGAALAAQRSCLRCDWEASLGDARRPEQACPQAATCAGGPHDLRSLSSRAWRSSSSPGPSPPAAPPPMPPPATHAQPGRRFGARGRATPCSWPAGQHRSAAHAALTHVAAARPQRRRHGLRCCRRGRRLRHLLPGRADQGGVKVDANLVQDLCGCVSGGGGEGGKPGGRWHGGRAQTLACRWHAQPLLGCSQQHDGGGGSGPHLPHKLVRLLLLPSLVKHAVHCGNHEVGRAGKA